MQLSGQFAADNRAEHKTHARSRRRRASHKQLNTHEKRADAAEALGLRRPNGARALTPHTRSTKNHSS